jgi:ribosomal protein S18 acetylase RimI-like enzyme
MPPDTPDPGAVRVRRATVHDAALLADLGARTFVDGYSDLMDRAALETAAAGWFGRDLQAAELVDPAVRVGMAEVDGAACGYVHITEAVPEVPIEGGHPVRIERLYVDASAQGMGVGRALYDWARAEARGLGADVLWLGVWERNARAIAIYERWGFVAVGEVPFPIGEESHRDLVMARPLG